MSKWREIKLFESLIRVKVFLLFPVSSLVSFLSMTFLILKALEGRLEVEKRREKMLKIFEKI